MPDVTKKELDELVEALKETVGATDEGSGELIEQIVKLISLPEEQFELLAPGILQSYQQTVNNPNDKLTLAQSFNAAGLRAEDLTSAFAQISEEIDKSPLPAIKRDFLKQLIMTLINAVNDTEGIAKRNVSVAIELCHPDAKIPQYSSIHDAGADVYAIEDATIHPGETKIIPTGFKIALPPGFAILIHPRSGLSARTKMRIANSIGLCDAGYRDEYKIIIENIEPAIKDISYSFNEDGTIKIDSILHGSDVHISKGERIAQLRLVEVPKINFYRVDDVMKVDNEDRGGGLGHSGNF